MKLPSLEYLARHSLSTLRRFPWVLAAAFSATLMAVAGIEQEHARSRPGWVFHAMLVSGLGISLLFGCSMALERARARPSLRLAVFLAAAAALAGYALSMPFQSEFHLAARYALFLLASHLFVAVAPFLRTGYTPGFWEYNHRLFLRIILSAVFSGCLFLGLAGAVAAVKYLFEIDALPERVFAWLWVAVAGVFNTWVFLAGVPRTLGELEGDHPYPAPLKVLAQFILAPLVTLYLLILYAYAARILAAREWPIGWVSVPILACALLGILSILLIHPLRDRDGNPWIKAFSRAFFIAMFPLLALLFAAVGKRIAEYRLTESRYFALLLAAWIAGIALYFIFSRKRDLRAVPLTLGALALLASGGPWGAFQAAARSQSGRLQELLEAHGLMRNGKLAPAPSPIGRKAEAEIGSVVDYLMRRKATERARAWVPDSALAADTGLMADRHAFLALMGLKYVRDYRGEPSVRYRSFRTRPGTIHALAGYDYYMDDFQSSRSGGTAPLTPAPHGCRAGFSVRTGSLRIRCGDSSAYDFELRPWLDSLDRETGKAHPNNLPPERMFLRGKAGKYGIGVQVKSLSLAESDSAHFDLGAGIFIKLPD